ncbi:hypothetical protein HNR46_002887 [Haloferula luteola]|uniref:Uncharacterized protein n=1 Tax=Haloferula luteola TaxID=595692 RepID=A0A840VFP4_9BACT|nr:hypothetical protein [Haloferula luteola]MBB5352639.1 hypothetical protein [Haloferula luteola]
MSASDPSYHRARQGLRKHTLGLLAWFGSIMLVFGFLATWVNPLWITPSPWSSASFDHYKPVHKHPRLGKTGLVRSGKWDAILLGSSRVDIAFDPQHPAFGDLRVANLALRGGTITEHRAMLEYAYARQPLKLVVVGVDLADLTSRHDVLDVAGFQESPLSESGDPFEKELRYRFGTSAFEMSVKTLDYRFTKRLSAYSPQGQWVRQLDKRPLRQVLQYESFMWANRFIKERHKGIAGNPDKVEDYRQIIRFCLDHHLRLFLCIPPNHAAFLSVFRLKGDPDPGFRTDREIMTSVIAEETQGNDASSITLWDFNDFHPYNCEALPPIDQPRKPTYYWADGTHALPTLGSIMLSRMMDLPPAHPEDATYGTPLTTENLDDREQTLRDGYLRYQKDHPEDFAWVENHMNLWKPN